MKCSAAILALSLLFAEAASAARFDLGPSGYTSRVWQIQDGLQEDVVQAFAQTPDRFFWIGTTGGLVRFDGAAWIVFDHTNTPALLQESILCLLTSRDGSLWIGTEGGGLVLYHDGVFRLFSRTDGLTSGFIRAIFQDHFGVIWVGTDGGLFRVAGSTLKRVDGIGEIPTLCVRTIGEDASFGLWIGGPALVRIAQGKATSYSLPGGLGQNRIKTILTERDGTVWVGTVSGLYEKKGGQAAESFEKVKGVAGTVRTLWQSAEGALWIGTIGNGISILDHHHMTVLHAPRWLPSNTVLSLFEDAEKDIWIGTQHGLLRLSKTSVKTVPLPGNADSDFGTVYQDSNGDLWMASSKLFRIRDGVARPFIYSHLGGAQVRNVFRDQQGALWLGTDGAGAFRYLAHGFEHLTTVNGLVNNYIRAFLQARDGSVWIATDGGISHWRNDSFTNYLVRDGLCYNNDRSLLEDSHGDIWVGTERGLSHLRDGEFVHDDVTKALGDEKIWSMHEDEDGAVWFATRTNGLYRWKSASLAHLTTAEGLVSNSIYQVLEDGDHNFWMSGPDGVSVVRRTELDEVAEHPGQRLAVKLFGVSQGVEMTQLYGGTQPSGILTANGGWFPSGKGAINISISAVRAPKAGPPPVIIGKVLVDGQEHQPDTRVTSPMLLKPGSRKIQFSYAAVALRSPEDIRFRYKLDGFDKYWTDSDPQRQVYYTNLAPGDYRFRVLAYNIDNPSGTTEAFLNIKQEPFFYRSPWFVACCLLAIGSLVWVSHLRHLEQLRLRFQAVLEERNRVAREMHDTIIQGCVSVSTLLEGISSQDVGAQEERGNLLNHARNQLRSTLDEARRALWNLRREATLTTEMVPLLASLAGEISTEANTRISCETTGKQFPIPASRARELLMVTREALYNAVHHSGASTVSLRINFARDILDIQVSDNGKGFDYDLTGGLAAGHYGLLGMRERVQRMNGEFVLKTSYGAGTHLQFKIPCGPTSTTGT